MTDDIELEEADGVAAADAPDEEIIAGGDRAEEIAAPAKLVVKRSGVETTDEFPVNPPAIVGRFDPAVGPVDVDLGSIPEAVYVSRKHAKISNEDGVWKIQDLGSSNGTFILRSDFERVEEAELSDGSEIAFGNARFIFRLGDSSAPAPQADVAEGSAAVDEPEAELN